jgi:putative membrane protein
VQSRRVDVGAEDLRDRFWHDVLAARGAATWVVTRDAAIFTLLALGVCVLDKVVFPHASFSVDVAPYEVAGGVLALLLVLRTNAGYDRWWEARKLWGGITNSTRNLVLTAAVHGPDDPAWRDLLARWTAAFAHVTRRSLRGERELPEVARLLGPDPAARLASARHMPTEAARQIDRLLRDAFARPGADGFAFQEALRRRAELIDHIGGCERILKSPLPRPYAVYIRRFLVLFLVTLPEAMLSRVEWYLTPVVTLLVAYPLLALDEVGAQLQNPFWVDHLGHLPLDDICAAIEADLLALAAAPFPAAAPGDNLSGGPGQRPPRPVEPRHEP